MPSSSSTPSSSTDHISSSTSIVDGVTSDNGGGREEGDVELALFKRIRSFSNLSRPSKWGDYHRYLQHPLSMFSSADVDNDTRPSSSDDQVPQSELENRNSNNERSSSSSLPPEPDEKTDTNARTDKPAHGSSSSVAWRDALVQACASMLGKTLDELRVDYNHVVSVSTPSATTFGSQSTTFEPIPRDLADYAIITTLKHQDPSTMQNAPSWLFNMMDRTGAGFVLRDEFIRYAPFIGPIADFAVAGIVFDELVREQVRQANESAASAAKELARQQKRSEGQNKQQREQNEKEKRRKEKQKQQQRKQQGEEDNVNGQNNISNSRHSSCQQDQQQNGNGNSKSNGLRQRKSMPSHPLELDPSERTHLNINFNNSDSINNISNRYNALATPSASTSSSSLLKRHFATAAAAAASDMSLLSNTTTKHSTAGTSNKPPPSPASADIHTPRVDLFPPSAALQFDMWRLFFQAVQDKYHYVDEDWVRVKREIGVDPEETLIKSQGALDHSDLFPTLGKLYLSQRYLIFFAAVGRNHYVVRLGAIAEVSTDAIPFMMRDCVRIRLESEAKVAMDGVSAVVSHDQPAIDDDILGKESKNSNGHGSDKKKKKHDGNGSQHEHIEEQVSQHIGKLMRQFMGGRKPLVFSLLEFRETKRRDNWVNLIREMAAAYKLHAQLGFGSAGRAVRDVNKRHAGGTTGVGGGGAGSSSSISGGDAFGMSDDDDDDGGGGSGSNSGGDDNNQKKGNNGKHKNNNNNNSKDEKSHKNFSLNYARSPFRSEPSPPLLAVAAHSNIVRFRALRRVTAKRVSRSLLVFSDEERKPWLVNWYTDSVRAYQSQSGRTWIERALSAIRENMDTNDRMYRVQDDEPFDIGKLGDEIGRFAELCAPLVRVIQLLDHLIQWRNPPATILALLVCLSISLNGYVHYVPAFTVLLQALWVVETKVNVLGLGMGGAASEDAAQRQRNVLQLVAQVHDALAAGQNVLTRLNRELGKVQTLCLWGCDDDRKSWIVVATLALVSLILLVVPARTIFLGLMFFLFSKHFMPPSNPALRFWQTVPSRINVQRRRTKTGNR